MENLYHLTSIIDYHAHVYYDATSKPLALQLREAIKNQFEVTLGRCHDRLVGPHPCWSYQVAFDPEVFGSLIPWLALNRSGLVIFAHPNTGNALVDHRDRAIWMGEKMELDLEKL